MGIYGLTSYLRDHKRVIGETLTFSSTCSGTTDRRTTVVVDGWSFIYGIISDDANTWVYGGEYEEFAHQVHAVVKAWWAVGLKPYFVFDGPVPPFKLLTSLTRLQKSRIQPAQLFFRTSQASRSTTRFLIENRIIPPLSHDCCVRALTDLRKQAVQQVKQNSMAGPGAGGAAGSADGDEPALEIFFADAEADDFAVQLAARIGLGGEVGAYVTGRDSDFVVFNADGYGGYIPLDEMTWVLEETQQGHISNRQDSVDDGWETQTPRKKKRKPTSDAYTGRGFIPPSFNSDVSLPDGARLTLTCTLYTPTKLADQLTIPLPLLPLLGAMVGNDYTLGPAVAGHSSYADASSDAYSSSPKNAFTSKLFPRTLSPTERIPYTAKIIVSHLRSTTNGGKKRQRPHTPASVMQLIEMTVVSLLSTNPFPVGSGEEAEIVNLVVEGTLPYALPKPPTDDEGQVLDLWPTETCVLHDPASCPLAEVFLPNPEDGIIDDCPQRCDVLKLYNAAYHTGLFSPDLLDVLITGTHTPELFLEHPDLEAVSRSVGRIIRVFSYAILNHEVGLPEAEEDEVDEEAVESPCQPENITMPGVQGGELEDGDEDELIDVIEEDSESEGDLASVADVMQLRGALRSLQIKSSPPSDDGEVSGHGDDASDLQGSLATTDTASRVTGSMSTNTARKMRRKSRRTVTEYVRKGTRVTGEEVEVLPLEAFKEHLPRHLLEAVEDGAAQEIETQASGLGDSARVPVQSLVLSDVDVRLTTLLSFLHSDGPAVQTAYKRNAQDLMPILVTRWVVRRMHDRAHDRPAGFNIPGSGRDKERWTLREAKALLGAFGYPDGSATAVSTSHGAGTIDDVPSQDSSPLPLNDRAVQLTAQALQAIEAIKHLVQILMLTEQVSYCGHRFSGRRFHAALARNVPRDGASPVVGDMPAAVSAALCESIESCFAEEVQYRKKAKTKPPLKGQSSQTGSRKAKTSGMFSLLSQLDNA